MRLTVTKGEAPVAKKVTKGLITNVVQALAARRLISGRLERPFFIGNSTTEQNCVSMENEILNIESVLSGSEQCLRPHTAEWFSTTSLPYGFDPQADCPRWRRFLERNLEGDAERIGILKEFFGLCLLPSTDFQKFLVMVGEGANGKSVALAVLTALLGRENVSHVPLESFGSRFQANQTLGKLANICPEVGEIDKVAEGTLKAFTSGDRMQFERKFKDPIEAFPTARMVIATNNLPRFSDRSGGLWRRMLLMPFQVTIPETERVVGMDKPTWWADQNELSGIFNWALEGLRRLRSNGRFTASGVRVEAVEQHRLDCNPARTFLLANCREQSNGTVMTSDVYKKYQQWCLDHGYKPLGDSMFGKEIGRAFPSATRQRVTEFGQRVWVYAGICDGCEL